MALSDEKIIDLYFKRDENAITETDVKYHNYLIKISYNILSDMEDCEETLNDTYLKTWNSVPPNRPVALPAYLGKINRQAAIDIYRKKNSQKRKGSEYNMCYEELEETCAQGEGVEDTIDVSILGQCINQFVKGLPENKRIAFVGRYFYMDSVKEIAAYSGMTESNIKTLLFRCRNELREYLLQEGYTV